MFISHSNWILENKNEKKEPANLLKIARIY